MGGATLTSLLPFAWEEFTVLEVVLLDASLIVTVRRIAAHFVRHRVSATAAFRCHG